MFKAFDKFLSGGYLRPVLSRHADQLEKVIQLFRTVSGYYDLGSRCLPYSHFIYDFCLNGMACLGIVKMEAFVVPDDGEHHILIDFLAE